MFLVTYGIAKTIHRMPGENYVLPMSSSNILRIYQRNIFSVIKMFSAVKHIFGSKIYSVR